MNAWDAGSDRIGWIGRICWDDRAGREDVAGPIGSVESVGPFDSGIWPIADSQRRNIDYADVKAIRLKEHDHAESA
ncbi:hypothetical protein THI4931_50330 [Pandoraea sputorum]|nr:hypothetical protein THI4931_50330 [Pandoraea sputorum]